MEKSDYVSLKQIWFNAARGMKCLEEMCMSKHGAFGCTVLSSFGTNDSQVMS